jgi:hypothetical protein
MAAFGGRVDGSTERGLARYGCGIYVRDFEMAPQAPQEEPIDPERIAYPNELPIGIKRALEEREIAVRPSVVALLRLSSELAQQRRKDAGLVSLSTIFCSAAAFRIRPFGITIEDYAEGDERERLEQFRNALEHVSDDQWRDFVEAVFSQPTIELPALKNPVPEAVFSGSSLKALSKLAGQSVGAVELIQTILETPSISLTSDLLLLGMKPYDLLTALGALGATTGPSAQGSEQSLEEGDTETRSSMAMSGSAADLSLPGGLEEQLAANTWITTPLVTKVLYSAAILAADKPEGRQNVSQTGVLLAAYEAYKQRDQNDSDFVYMREAAQLRALAKFLDLIDPERWRSIEADTYALESAPLRGREPLAQARRAKGSLRGSDCKMK